jgi:HD domain-containing protein
MDIAAKLSLKLETYRVVRQGYWNVVGRPYIERDAELCLARGVRSHNNEVPLTPPSIAAARALLVELGASRRLLRHVELVGEAAELLLAKLAALGVDLRADFVRIGVVLHDAGKVLHPAELDGAGGQHEPAGEALLIKHGVSADLARICLSHARWRDMPLSSEELVVALADKQWKGVRNVELEERVVDCVAALLCQDRWSLFVELDTLFEEIAADGANRLERSR